MTFLFSEPSCAYCLFVVTLNDCMYVSPSHFGPFCFTDTNSTPASIEPSLKVQIHYTGFPRQESFDYLVSLPVPCSLQSCHYLILRRPMGTQSFCLCVKGTVYTNTSHYHPSQENPSFCIISGVCKTNPHIGSFCYSLNVCNYTHLREVFLLPGKVFEALSIFYVLHFQLFLHWKVKRERWEMTQTWQIEIFG